MTGKYRKLLRPLSLLYAEITGIRNKLFDKQILQSNRFDIPVIVVGNLRVGGTGKSPQVMYLVELLKTSYRIAVLSRGYKRKTKGFVLADSKTSYQDVGDEAYQLFQRHPDILVAVSEDRTAGIKALSKLENSPELVILDDAFQHRKVEAGFNILLTAYDDLYIDDEVLPAGNLREKISGADRAQVIVVTKCPQDLDEDSMYRVALKLQVSLKQTVFFSYIKYDNSIRNHTESLALSDIKSYQILLITGIANPQPLVTYLKSEDLSLQHIEYPDHYEFKEKDLIKIRKTYDAIATEKKIILTTEKDYVRIFGSLDNLYYLGIETNFINHQEDFDTLILKYVGKNRRDR